MANRHYGYDVSLLTFKRDGSRPTITVPLNLLFESADFSVDPTIKESTAAQDVGPNRRVIGTDFSLSLNKFVEGNFEALATLFTEDPNDYKDINLVIAMTVAGAGNTGRPTVTLHLFNCVCTKTGFNLGGDATKESLEFKRGTGRLIDGAGFEWTV